ncbi:MAG: Glu/Leu/Phe/Val dehydrogenase dimerization domain-containing protein [Actinomycetota bacterium]
MGVFSKARGFERVVYAQDPRADLRAIIAIHSTRLGPALGGCRIQPYRTEDEIRARRSG